MNIVFESDRLFFRKFTPDDTMLIYELNKDPEVTKYLHEPPTTELNAVDIIQNIFFHNINKTILADGQYIKNLTKHLLDGVV